MTLEKLDKECIKRRRGTKIPGRATHVKPRLVREHCALRER